MISVQIEGAKFNFRVAGIVVEDGHVLLHRNAEDDFWALPGGRCEIMENTTVTLQREFQEELGLDVNVERLVYALENFFYMDDRDGKKPYHELGFYYKVALTGDSELRRDKEREHRGIETDVHLIYKWFRVEELDGVELYPFFLRQGIQNLPDTVQHVLYDERHYYEGESK